MDEKQQIQQSLTEFIKSALETSHIFGLKDGSEIKLNKAIYEIQNHLNKELNRYGINTRLDVGIISTSITKSFSEAGYKPHKSEYYAYPFLKHLYHHFKVGTELLEYIDGFIDENKENLSWQDIVITKTGATRCKTNIRFSLNLLRDLHLVRSRNENDKRTLLPTVIGQLLIHYFDWINEKHSSTIRLEQSISFGGYAYFGGHLARLKEPDVLTEFLTHIKVKLASNTQDFTRIENYLKRFTEIILKALTVTKSGIKYDASLKKTPEYKLLLGELNSDFIFLRK
jgi:hypothetical protein